MQARKIFQSSLHTYYIRTHTYFICFLINLSFDCYSIDPPPLPSITVLSDISCHSVPAKWQSPENASVIFFLVGVVWSYEAEVISDTSTFLKIYHTNMLILTMFIVVNHCSIATFPAFSSQLRQTEIFVVTCVIFCYVKQ